MYKTTYNDNFKTVNLMKKDVTPVQLATAINQLF